jgi:hypothetical protein
VARAAVGWGFALLVLTHIGLSAAVETVAPQIRDPEYGYRQFGAIELQKAHPNRPLLLVLGTSRTQNAIDPSSMGFPDEPGAPVVYNAGLSGSWPLHLWLHYHTLRDAGVRPSFLLIEILPGGLSWNGPVDDMVRPHVSRLCYSEVRRLKPYLADPDELLRRWALTRANSLHTLRPVVIERVAPKWQPTQALNWHKLALDRYGFTPIPFDTVAEEMRQRKREEMRKAYWNVLQSLSVSELSDRAYRQLVADCRADGIPVAFFLTPESPVFRSWYPPASRAAVTAYCRKLTDELGCPVFAAPEGYAENEFMDGHHMLRPTAHRFSRDLAEQHLKPWLASIR